ncbi:hypothetical protein [Burkholderia sp. Ac-20353]|uniref:hypothetical protein n=1 Tax=Burkholderia sp. Ac-20353 TaxID=2703894 RepID=UPI00197C5B59|nr:hypothetical protein [Burkholderia sp. Ac-20353]MBN3788817.1 hypothetical protein [Burkholderia sp. Ac-20353]
MDTHAVTLLAPTVSNDGTIVFSAYRVGEGYGSFAISPAVMSAALGAADQSDLQSQIAFEANRERIASAVARQFPLDDSGSPRYLRARDL